MTHPIVLVLSLGLTFAAPARAPNPEAEKLIDQGVDLREQGKDVEAAELFQRAYEMSESARALAQLALAQQALGRWVEAESNLSKALADKNDAWIKARAKPLADALKKIQERLGSLDVLGTKGAELHVNGATAGTLVPSTS